MDMYDDVHTIVSALYGVRQRQVETAFADLVGEADISASAPQISAFTPYMHRFPKYAPAALTNERDSGIGIDRAGADLWFTAGIVPMYRELGPVADACAAQADSESSSPLSASVCAVPKGRYCLLPSLSSFNHSRTSCKDDAMALLIPVHPLFHTILWNTTRRPEYDS